MTSETITGTYEVLEALEASLQSADPIKRQELATVLDAYHDDFPEDFHWALGASSPTLLSNLLMAVDAACRSSEQSKSRNVVVRLIDRKPEGSA